MLGRYSQTVLVSVWPYWFVFFLSAAMALAQTRALGPTGSRKIILPISWWYLALFFILLIGLRHEVGADWFTYVMHVEDAYYDSFIESLASKDVAYGLLNWLGAHGLGGIYFVNFVSAVIFTVGLFKFCWSMPRPALALVASVPYLVIVVAMGYTRQGGAIGIVLLALTQLQRRRFWNFVVGVAVAALFHKSAAILLPLAFVFRKGSIWLKVFWVAVLLGLIFYLAIADAVEYIQTVYVDRQYDSSGAAVRLFMNAVPAMILLIFHRRFRLEASQLMFWRGMSASSILLLVLLPLAPSTTVLDRIALYWIPLQLFVWSRVPEVFGISGSVKNQLQVAAVILYSAVVLFIWMFFGANSYTWIPYQFYPWVLIWR